MKRRFLNRDVCSEVGRRLPLRDWLSFILVSKEAYRSLEYFPNSLELFELSLTKQNFKFTIKILKTHPKIDKNHIFNEISLGDNWFLECAIEYACYYSNLELVEFLLTDEKLNPFREGIDALSWAASFNRISIVQRLLADHRADSASSLYTNSLSLACEKGNVDVVSLLLDHFKTIEGGGDFHYEAFLASKFGHVKVLRKLMQHSNINFNNRDFFSFEWACIEGHVEIVKAILMDHNFNPSIDDNSAIKSACVNGNFEVVSLLLRDSRVNPAVDNDCCIHLAAEKGYFEIVCKLLEDGRVDPVSNENEAYYLATLNSHEKVVERLLEDHRVREYIAIDNADNFSNFSD